LLEPPDIEGGLPLRHRLLDSKRRGGGVRSWQGGESITRPSTMWMLRCAPGTFRVVSDEHDGGAPVVDLLQQVHDLARHERIEVARGLIRPYQRRIAGNRARDGDALLLAAAELRAQMPHA
jgi:hypothetical protein